MAKARWSWDLDRIHAKGYTDNVVDLMVGKLNRLPVDTQKALQQLACLGNSAAVRTLSHRSRDIGGGGPCGSVGGRSSGAGRAPGRRLPVRPRPGSGSRLFADPGGACAPRRIFESGDCSRRTRLRRSGRRRSSRSSISSTAARALITSRDEREQLAELNLIAGKRAKASTAYASALNYLVAGAALLPEDCWERQHELTFALELHRAECEFLTGALAAAEERLDDAFSARRRHGRTCRPSRACA